MKNVAVIPRRALVGPDRVVVVDEAGGLRFRSLTIVWQESGQVLVSAGLQPGDRVVLTALAAVVVPGRAATVVWVRRASVALVAVAARAASAGMRAVSATAQQVVMPALVALVERVAQLARLA